MKKKQLYLFISAFVLVLLFSFITTSCGSSAKDIDETTTTTSATFVSETTVAESSSTETTNIETTESTETEDTKTLQDLIKIEKTYFDIPSLIGKDAFEIKDILERSIGKPDTFTEPEGEFFGTLGWTLKIEDTKNSLMFGYDYFKDGKIDVNTLVLTGIIEENEPTFTIADVIRAGNLNANSTDYKIDIHRNDDTFKEIWIITNQ